MDIKLNVQVLTETGVVFDELRGIKLNYKNGTLWTPQSIKVVRPNDLSAGNQPDGDDAGVVRVKVPSAGGLVAIGYTRGGREHKHTLLIPNPRQWE